MSGYSALLLNNLFVRATRGIRILTCIQNRNIIYGLRRPSTMVSHSLSTTTQRLLARVCDTPKIGITSDIMCTWRATDYGFVSATTTERDKILAFSPNTVKNSKLTPSSHEIMSLSNMISLS